MKTRRLLFSLSDASEGTHTGQVCTYMRLLPGSSATNNRINPAVLDNWNRSIDRSIGHLTTSQRSPERTADDCQQRPKNQKHRRRSGRGTSAGRSVTAAGHFATHQLSAFHRVRLVTVRIDRWAYVLVLALQHRQLVPRRFLQAGQSDLFVRPQDPRIMDLEAVSAP